MFMMIQISILPFGLCLKIHTLLQIGCRFLALAFHLSVTL